MKVRPLFVEIEVGSGGATHTLVLLKGTFRLAANLLQPATVIVRCSKNRKISNYLQQPLALCNSCRNLRVVWMRLKAEFTLVHFMQYAMKRNNLLHKTHQRKRYLKQLICIKYSQVGLKTFHRIVKQIIKGQGLFLYPPIGCLTIPFDNFVLYIETNLEGRFHKGNKLIES